MLCYYTHSLQHQNNENMHQPVLLNTSLKFLDIKPNGVYIDATFGRGGHSKMILEQLSLQGRLLAFDQDPDAVAYAHDNFNQPNFTIIHDNFIHYYQYLQRLNINKIDGCLLDLGVCSTQLDHDSRGFSFKKEAMLDMRMDNSKGITAAQWLKTASVKAISDVLWFYGEERFNKKIALAIDKARNKINTTLELAELVKQTIPYHEHHKHPATRTFQALRIFINDELLKLDNILSSAPAILTNSGKLVVISFHSLEDRIVKKKFKYWSEQEQYYIIAKKIRPNHDEIKNNRRSRSAIMRVLEKKYEF